MLPTQERKAMVRGSLWMVLVSLALFFVPAVNGLVAGLIGGYRIGNVGRALLVALGAGAAVALGIWLILTVTHPPLIGVLAGVAVAAWVLVSEAGLLAGAALGAMSHPAEAA